MSVIALMGRFENSNIRIPGQICNMMYEICKPEPTLMCNRCNKALLVALRHKPFLKNVPTSWQYCHGNVFETQQSKLDPGMLTPCNGVNKNTLLLRQETGSMVSVFTPDYVSMHGKTYRNEVLTTSHGWIEAV